MSNRITLIEEALKALEPTFVEVTDNSHLHVGHAGAKSGKGHFAVKVEAACFEGKNQIQRHRMVFKAMGNLFETDIHALEIKAVTNN